VKVTARRVEPDALECRAVLVPDHLPALTSGGDIDIVCAGCGSILAARVAWGLITSVVVRCAVCGVHGDLTQYD